LVLLVVTVKRSVDELFMYYFHVSSASAGFISRPAPAIYPWTPLGDFHPQTNNLPTAGKSPAGAHDLQLLDGLVCQ